MTYASILWRVELRALFALFVYAIAMGLYLGMLSAIAGAASAVGGAAVGWWTGISTFLFGFLPVTLFGAPLYSYFLYRSRATWRTALIVGAIPAVPIVVFSLDVAWLVFLSGLVVAAVAHLLTLARPLTTRSSGP